MTEKSCLISGVDVLERDVGGPVVRRDFGGEDFRLGCDEETGDLRGAETMTYQISDCTSPRPFTRMSTTARLK